MLDVARQTFLQSMEDIYQTADAMTEENGYQVKVRLPLKMGTYYLLRIVLFLLDVSAPRNIRQPIQGLMVFPLCVLLLVARSKFAFRD